MTVMLLVSRWQVPVITEGSVQLVQTSSFLCCQLLFSANEALKLVFVLI